MATSTKPSFPSKEAEVIEEPDTTENPPREPLAGDDLKAAIEQRKTAVNPRVDSAAQREEEVLAWVLDLMDPQPEPKAEDEEEVSVDG